MMEVCPHSDLVVSLDDGQATTGQELCRPRKPPGIVATREAQTSYKFYKYKICFLNDDSLLGKVIHD